jgi:hypothetical protein
VTVSFRLCPACWTIPIPCGFLGTTHRVRGLVLVLLAGSHSTPSTSTGTEGGSGAGTAILDQILSTAPRRIVEEVAR